MRQRLKEFEGIGKSSQRTVFAELCFCLCTPQSKAVTCNKAINDMIIRGTLYEGGKDKVLKSLDGIRFKNTKAGRIIDARELFTDPDGKMRIKDRIDREHIQGTRDWLVNNIKGMGYKEASHFLRNIGLGKEVAILDRHILRNLKSLGVIDDVPKTLTKKKYMEIEDRMKRFAGAIGIPLIELDLLLWSQETGHVFK
ncbi:MAG: DNA lyase [Candidatus Aenigmatarchaeota archaeon]|nr:MAG: DNA lyase [Candidatus Aenigmarchaeota archaeon]